MSLKDIPREEVPWFPTVNTEKCTGCRACVDFCSHGTYDWDEEKGVSVVANPYNCVVGCHSCESLCPVGAITFPDLSVLKEVREKYKK